MSDETPTPYDYSKLGFMAVCQGARTDVNSDGTLWEHDLWEIRVPLIKATKKINYAHEFDFLLRNNRADEFFMHDHLREVGWTTFEYKTGSGLRIPIKAQFYGRLPYRHRPPTIKDFLNSVLRDYQGETFDEWCDNYGYSNDSIKAFEVYRKCQENYTKICKCIPVSEHEAILADLQDY